MHLSTTHQNYSIGGSVKDIMYVKQRKQVQEEAAPTTPSTPLTEVDPKINTSDKFFKGLKHMIALKKKNKQEEKK